VQERQQIKDDVAKGGERRQCCWREAGYVLNFLFYFFYFHTEGWNDIKMSSFEASRCTAQNN